MTTSPSREILSLFCGCGGLDLGFEMAGFTTSLAYDRRREAVSSWNRNRKHKVARVQDIQELNLSALDEHHGGMFSPMGVIGGPPCQGFSLANRKGHVDDPRNKLVSTFIDISLALNARKKISFIAMENVPAISGARGGSIVESITGRLEDNGFTVKSNVMNSVEYGVPQHRKRFILVAINQSVTEDFWSTPPFIDGVKTVRDAIGSLPEPRFFSRGIDPACNPFHENHWCMTPKSRKFFDGTLIEGYKDSRSFKTLRWDEPSYTVSYGNREVHIHPDAKRRISVFEAMRLQGFPDSFVLDGTLSSQITQVSEAVPPPLAAAIAQQIAAALKLDSHDPR